MQFSTCSPRIIFFFGMSNVSLLVPCVRFACTGCGLDELLSSLRKEATSEAEGIAVEGKPAALDLDVRTTLSSHLDEVEDLLALHEPAPHSLAHTC